MCEKNGIADTINVTVWDDGDRSVGIQGTQIDMQIPVWLIEGEMREQVREQLRTFWTEMLDFKVQVQFDDEGLEGDGLDEDGNEDEIDWARELMADPDGT